MLRILLKTPHRNIVSRNPPNCFISQQYERVDFRECGDIVTVFQRDSAGVGNRDVNDHDIGADRANLFDGVFWMKIFPTNHFESGGPETLLVRSLFRYMQLAEAIDNFEVRRFQSCKFLLVKIAVCGAPSFDEFTNRSYCEKLP